MPLYGGIDLHGNNSVVVLINEQDQVLYQKRLPNDLATILKQLAPYHTEIEGLVVESTYNWYWLVDGLMEAGYCMHLANPAAIRQYSGLKYSDDHSDARWLAHLLRLGVLPEGYIYPRSEARDILRYHRDFSQSAPDEVVSVAGLMSTPEGEPVIALPVCYNGPLTKGERVLDKLRHLSTPLADDIGPKSYVEVQNMLDPAAFPHGMERYWKSSFLKDPGDNVLDLAYEYASQMTSPL